MVAAVHHDPLFPDDVLLLLGVRDLPLLDALQGERLAILLRDLKQIATNEQQAVPQCLNEQWGSISFKWHN